jgi:hypothetical protein
MRGCASSTRISTVTTVSIFVVDTVLGDIWLPIFKLGRCFDYYAALVFLVTSLDVIEKHKQRVMGCFVLTSCFASHFKSSSYKLRSTCTRTLYGYIENAQRNSNIAWGDSASVKFIVMKMWH